ncbi:MAG: hypothetical protein DMD29_14640, partial [Gemmatimonadetes bacterium]
MPNGGGGVTLSATVPGLGAGTYHWQARVRDQTGRASVLWTAFTSPAFTVLITGPILSVTPGSVSDTGLANGSARTATLTIANTGSRSLTWNASKAPDSAWLSLGAPTTGTLTSGTSTTLTLTLSPTGLAAGQHADTVIVDAGAVTGSPTKIPVIFTVQQPVLSVRPGSVAHIANAGSSTTFTDTLRISNAGTGPLSWAAMKLKNQPWLTLNKTSGPRAPDSLVITIAVGVRPAGIYVDTVVVTAPGATGSPDSIPVTLTLQQPVLAVAPSSVTSLNWSASLAPSVSWLSLSGSPGLAPSDLVLALNPTGPAGTLTDTVVITSADANNSPLKVLVTFRIRQPVLSVTPSPVQDSAQQGDTAVRIKTLTVSNTGGGTLTWAATTKGATWLTIVPTLGGVGTITVTLRPASLATGDHLDTITVAPNGWTGTSVKVPVLFRITPLPQLSVTSSSKPDTAYLGSTAPTTSPILITNAGGGTLNWAATKDNTWVGLSKLSGTAPLSPLSDTTILSLSPGGLALGAHIGHVVITAAGALSSPDTVAKTLVIVPCAVHPVTPDALDAGSLTT